MPNRRSDFPPGTLVRVESPGSLHHGRTGVVFTRPPTFLRPPAQWPVSVWFGDDEVQCRVHPTACLWNNFHPDELTTDVHFREGRPLPSPTS